MPQVRTVEARRRRDGTVAWLQVALATPARSAGTGEWAAPDVVEVECHSDPPTVHATLGGRSYAIPGRAADPSGDDALRAEAARLVVLAEILGPVGDLTTPLRPHARQFAARVLGHLRRLGRP